VKAALAILCAIAVSSLQAQTLPSFEVASVRPIGPNEHITCGQFVPGGRLNIAGCRLVNIIAEAYSLREFQIADAPNWVTDYGDGARFNIQVRANDSADGDQLRLMLRSLLAERFQLLSHRETRDVPVYALNAIKGKQPTPAADNGKLRGSGQIEWVDAGRLRGRNVFLSRFVGAMGAMVDGPVVDKTNITSAIDFELRWTPDDKVDGEYPSVFTAVQEQLGLKLEPQRLPVEVLVIDHVERPTEN